MTKSISMETIKNRSLQFLAIMAGAILLPLATHAAGINGSIFIPIYTAVIIGCFFTNAVTAIAAALLVPVLNSLITGMPTFAPFPIAQVLIIELTVLAITINALKRKELPAIIIIFLAITAARLSSIILVPFFIPLSVNWWINHIIISIPGIAINVFLSALITAGLQKIVYHKE